MKKRIILLILKWSFSKLQSSSMALSDKELKILIEVLEGLIGYIITKTSLSPEDKDKLIELQDRLNVLKSKEQRIADGTDN